MVQFRATYENTKMNLKKHANKLIETLSAFINVGKCAGDAEINH